MFALIAAAFGAPGFDAQRFDPGPAWTGRHVVRGAPELAAGAWVAGLTGSYAWRPVTLDTAGRASPLVEHLAGADLAVGWAPSAWLRLGAALPLQVTVGEVPASLGAAYELGNGGAGPGDVAIDAAATAGGLGAAVRVGLPTGRRRVLAGGTGPFVRVDLSAEGHLDRLVLAVDLGLVARAGAEPMLGWLPSHELAAGLAVGVELDPDGRGRIGAELSAATVLARAFDPHHSPAEGWLTAGFSTPSGWSLDLGGGPGLGSAVGTPRLRGFARLSVRGATDPDPDDDGVERAADVCPSEPEDQDGHQDDDGCPDPDNDADSVPDGLDRCPSDAEDLDRFDDRDGCPDPDNDRDGVPDTSDLAPREPEDHDGYLDDDGRPEWDNDGDGMFDWVDPCPLDPEPPNGRDEAEPCPPRAP